MHLEHTTTERLSAYLERDLPEAECLQVQRHLEGCDQCRTELEALERQVADFSSLPMLAAPDGFSRRVMVRIEAREGRGVWAWIKRLKLTPILAPLALAATILVVVRTPESDQIPIPAIEFAEKGAADRARSSVGRLEDRLLEPRREAEAPAAQAGEPSSSPPVLHKKTSRESKTRALPARKARAPSGGIAGEYAPFAEASLDRRRVGAFGSAGQAARGGSSRPPAGPPSQAYAPSPMIEDRLDAQQKHAKKKVERSPQRTAKEMTANEVTAKDQGTGDEVRLEVLGGRRAAMGEKSVHNRAESSAELGDRGKSENAEYGRGAGAPAASNGLDAAFKNGEPLEAVPAEPSTRKPRFRSRKSRVAARRQKPATVDASISKQSEAQPVGRSEEMDDRGPAMELEADGKGLAEMMDQLQTDRSSASKPTASSGLVVDPAHPPDAVIAARSGPGQMERIAEIVQKLGGGSLPPESLPGGGRRIKARLPAGRYARLVSALQRIDALGATPPPKGSLQTEYVWIELTP